MQGDMIAYERTEFGSFVLISRDILLLHEWERERMRINDMNENHVESYVCEEKEREREWTLTCIECSWYAISFLIWYC